MDKTIDGKPCLGTGELSPEMLPTDQMKEMFNSSIAGKFTLGYSEPKGSLYLREIISTYLKTKGINASPSSILIVSGGLQGLQLIEDDVYGDLWFDTPPSNPLKAQDHQGLVLYMGSMSKTLGPGLRIGWIVKEGILLNPGNIYDRNDQSICACLTHTPLLINWKKDSSGFPSLFVFIFNGEGH